MSRQSSLLFQPVQLGPFLLKNRVVMAPLTRSRALAGDIPTPLAAEYYAQRASAGLIIAEATQISPQGKGYAFTPGIYDQAQVQGWKTIVDAVHAREGRIFLQLWHVGRISHPQLQPGEQLPVAPSAIRPAGKAFTEKGFEDFVTPRALDIGEIPGIVDDYRRAARFAKEAGFDGIEVHGANGYLIDQFLRDKTNQRTDTYGGSIENRARLLFEVLNAVTEIWPANQVGLRLSPVTPSNDIADSAPQPLFNYVVERLNPLGLAYLHVVEGATGGPRDIDAAFDFGAMRRLYQGTYIGNNGYDFELADQRLASGHVDLVAFGRPFIANPDLVERMKHGDGLNEIDNATLYGGGAKGYTDYQTLHA